MSVSKRQQVILDAIAQYPEAANDDALLITVVWLAQGWNSNHRLVDNLRRVASPETITRSRRKLHELGLITYSDKANKRRMKAFEQARDENSSFTDTILKRGGLV